MEHVITGRQVVSERKRVRMAYVQALRVLRAVGLPSRMYLRVVDGAMPHQRAEV